jgi:hypothetical protein
MLAECSAAFAFGRTLRASTPRFRSSWENEKVAFLQYFFSQIEIWGKQIIFWQKNM